jgi:rod shape-determining protein MreD
MNSLNAVILIVVTYLTVFVSASFEFAALTGTRIDLLPPLIVYCGLSFGPGMLALEAVLAGLWFDTLSANPLGISILPLFLAGYVVQWNRELILRDQTYAQFVLGALASFAVPLLTLLMLLAAGRNPLFGWSSVWQWLVMALAGGVFAPVCFAVLDRLKLAFNYQPAIEPSFRADREIKRGRL